MKPLADQASEQEQPAAQVPATLWLAALALRHILPFLYQAALLFQPVHSLFHQVKQDLAQLRFRSAPVANPSSQSGNVTVQVAASEGILIEPNVIVMLIKRSWAKIVFIAWNDLSTSVPDSTTDLPIHVLRHLQTDLRITPNQQKTAPVVTLNTNDAHQHHAVHPLRL